jgi:CHC2 zinc finger
MRSSQSFDVRRAWSLAFGYDIVSKKKSGPDMYRTLCPFHDERNASCDVSLSKNSFICRSCGAHGGTLDVIVRAGYATDRRDAAQWLKDRGAL